MKLKTVKKKIKRNGTRIFLIILLVVTIVTTIGSGILAAIYTLSNQ